MNESGDVETKGARKFSRWFWVCIIMVFLSLFVLMIDRGIPTFVFSAITIVPLAYVMGRATEELAAHLGPGAGGLLNATFGNATELIIAIFALSSGLVTIVKASLTGSIIGNILLVLGLSVLVGGIRHKEQKFDSCAATTRSTMLTLAVIAFLMPTLYVLFVPGGNDVDIQGMSLGISVILIAAYILGLLFSLRTHRHFYNPIGEEKATPIWSKKKSIMILALSTIGVAIESELLVQSIEPSMQTLGLSELFIGVILIAIVGNAAEHGSAIMMAWKNKMNLSVGIATSSSTQIALFVAPVLVFISYLFTPMTLDLQIFELVAIAISVAIVHMVSLDGKSNWYEGVLLLMVYTIIAIGFFFHPPVG